MKSHTLILWILSLILLSGCGTSRQVDTFLKATEVQVETGSKQSKDSNSSNISNSTELFDKVSSNTSDTEAVSGNGEYKEYSQSDFDSAINGGKTVVLMWHTPSCPTCVALEWSLSRSLSRIPAHTIVMKIDENKEKELTLRYKVKETNTVIILNTDGSEKRRTSGGIYTIDKLLYYL